MKKLLSKIVVYFLVIAIAVIGGYFKEMKHKESLRIAHNEYLNLNDSLHTLRTKYTNEIYVTNKALYFSRQQLNKSKAELKNLRIKYKNVLSMQKQTQIIERHIRTPVHDTIIIEGQKSKMVRNFSYKDKYLSMKGTIQINDISIDWQTFNKITAIIDRGKRKKRFLFFRYGRREPTVTVKNSNPYITITNLELL